MSELNINEMSKRTIIVNELPLVKAEVSTKPLSKAKVLEETALAERSAVSKMRRVKRYEIGGEKIRITEGQITIDNFEYAELLYAAGQLMELTKLRQVIKPVIRDCECLIDDIRCRMVGVNRVLDEMEQSEE